MAMSKSLLAIALVVLAGSMVAGEEAGWLPRSADLKFAVKTVDRFLLRSADARKHRHKSPRPLPVPSSPVPSPVPSPAMTVESGTPSGSVYVIFEVRNA